MVGQAKQPAPIEGPATKQLQDAKAGGASSSSSRPMTASAQVPSLAADMAAGDTVTSAQPIADQPAEMHNEIPRVSTLQHHRHAEGCRGCHFVSEGTQLGLRTAWMTKLSCMPMASYMSEHVPQCERLCLLLKVPCLRASSGAVCRRPSDRMGAVSGHCDRLLAPTLTSDTLAGMTPVDKSVESIAWLPGHHEHHPLVSGHLSVSASPLHCIVILCNASFETHQSHEHGHDIDALWLQALLQERHLLTCHVRPLHGSQESVTAMRLAVSTTTIEPIWTLAGDVQPSSSLNCHIIDFGKQDAVEILLSQLECFPRVLA